MSINIKADTLNSTRLAISGYDIYSSSIIKEGNTWKMWFGGWRTTQDVPDDRIFYSISNDQGITWSSPVVCLYIPNIQANDPSVIKVWNQQYQQYMYLMYYTYYDRNDPVNLVALATSWDGITWGNFGVVINKNNGIDNSGAWSPSAITLDAYGSNVYIYYNTNNADGRVFRSRLVGGTTLAETISVTPADGMRTNVDVSVAPDGTWWMFYNGGFTNSLGKSNFNTRKMYSSDGVSWTESTNNPIQQWDTNTTCTPHVVWTSSNTYALFFGFGTTSFLDFSIHRWDFTSTSEVISIPRQTVYTSSQASSAFSGINAIDNNDSTAWSSLNTPQTGLEYICVDLGATYAVKKVKLMPRSVNGTVYCFPQDFKIQYCSDLVSWQDVPGQNYVNYANPLNVEQVFTFASSINARYIRLIATKFRPDSYNNYYCQISEFRLEK